MLESGRGRFSRWAAAALIAVAAHAAGAAYSVMQWPEETEPDDAGNAIMLELVPIAAVAPVNSPNIAHGPLMEEAAAATQASQKKQQDVPDETPEVEPTPEPEPEVALPKPEPEIKEEPEEEEAEEATPEQESPQQANPVPLTTAPPRVEAEPTPKAVPSPGQAASRARAQATWHKALVQHLNRYKSYPQTARNRRVQGTVVIAFKVDRSGQLVSSRVSRSSGSSLLDAEALEVLKRANPVPAPPADAAGPVDLLLPIQFQIR